ncbi:hypothetical protein [Leuconostoc gasicomitatum]|uniref:hypothetical protein n=1 Tax=Leuconostoc gasicomitatum TaxID=115778 RepID=UPI000B7F761A|nr:hypothetical protein [Leuconostoc gasicomitatum]
MNTKISYFYLAEVGSDKPLSLYNNNSHKQNIENVIVSPRFGIVNADITKQYTFNFKLLVVDDPFNQIVEKSVMTGPNVLDIKTETDDLIIEEFRLPANGVLTFEITLNLSEDTILIDSRLTYLRIEI